jgi:stromal membrane-associated protein
MKNMGNLNANQIFNPNERRHPPPPDSDENDRGSEMEKFIRNKYQYKQFMAPAPATSPTSAPPPVPKDPVPGRSGGASLGSQSDVEDVIQLRRAPSRAKSTPIVSSKSSSHSQNVLSSFNPPPASSSVSSRAPVFGSGNLPYRPSTASALEPPPPSQRANSSKSHTYPQPVPIPPDPSPQPYNNQPRLQYASQVSPGPTNPLWQDMMSLSLSPGATSPSTSSTSGSMFSSPSYANGSSLHPPPSVLGAFRSNSDDVLGAPSRSFSLPSPSPSVAGMSAFGNAMGMQTNPSSPVNPFSHLGRQMTGTLSGGGSYGNQQSTLTNPFNTGGSTSFLNNQMTGYQGAPSQQTTPPWSSAPTSHIGQAQQQSMSQSPFGFGAMGGMMNTLPSSSVMLANPQSQSQQSFNMTSSSPFGVGGAPSSALSFQQAYQVPYTPGSSAAAPSFSSLPSTNTQAPSPFQHPFNMPSQQRQSPSPFNNLNASTQSSFAQSMLPAYLKNPGPPQPTRSNTNPFGDLWASSAAQNAGPHAGGSAWSGAR